MICPKCGAVQEEGTRICTACGAALPERPAPAAPGNPVPEKPISAPPREETPPVPPSRPTAPAGTVLSGGPISGGPASAPPRQQTPPAPPLQPPRAATSTGPARSGGPVPGGPVSAPPRQQTPPVPPSQPPQTATPETPAGKGSISSPIGAVVGTIILILGLWRFSAADTPISSTAFGGDFYTYTYQGIVAISELLVEIEKTLGLLVAAIGAAIDVWALRKK